MDLIKQLALFDFLFPFHNQWIRVDGIYFSWLSLSFNKCQINNKTISINKSLNISCYKNEIFGNCRYIAEETQIKIYFTDFKLNPDLIHFYKGTIKYFVKMSLHLDGPVDEWEADWSRSHQVGWSVFADGKDHRCLFGSGGKNRLIGSRICCRIVRWDTNFNFKLIKG